MLKEPQTSTNFLKRSDELAYTSPLLASRRRSLISPLSDKIKGPNRHQSITRNTASSLAKIVRPNPNEKQNTITTSPEPINAKRKLSTMRSRKPSLNPIGTAVDNKALTTNSTNSNDKIQRRKSWSSLSLQVTKDASLLDEKQAASGPLLQASGHSLSANEASMEDSLSTLHITEKKLTMKPKNGNGASSVGDVFESKSSDTNTNVLHVSESKITFSSNKTTDIKYSALKHSFKQPLSTHRIQNESSNDNKNNFVVEYAGNNLQLSSLETPSASTPAPDEISASQHPSSENLVYFDCNYHHHEDEQLPGYMRRPICAACNRNVKVTSSSEITAQVYCNDMSNRSSSAITSKNSSRRSSFSAIVTKSHPSHHGLIKSGKCCVPNKKCSNIMTKKTNISPITKKGGNVAYSNSIVQTTRNLASTYSNASINQFYHHCENDNSSSNRSFSSNKKGEQLRYIDYNKQRLVLRPDSPTSPIPTRRASEYIVSKTDTVYPSCPIQLRETSENENTNKDTIVQQRRLLAGQKWTAILSQQQQLLSAFMQCNENDGDLELIRDDITKLVKTTTNQEQLETTLLETQFKILQKFATMLLIQQQKNISSFTVHDHEIASPKKAIRKINSNEPESELLPLKTVSWQTKLEYSATRLRWGLCRWVGSFLVGTGSIEEQEYDSLGYPKGITVSGTCVTTELSLLPKSRQRYYKPNHDGKREIICHKYIINLNREQRLTRFQLLDEKYWVKDASVTKCEFSIKPENGKAKHCTVEFGLFNRRHHCRSCGRIFCQAHSSNVLPLFVSNGEERGEWSRVCDVCFFKSINSKYLTRA